MLPPAPLRFAILSDPSTYPHLYTFLMQRGIHIPKDAPNQTYDVVYFRQRAGRGYDVPILYEGGGREGGKGTHSSRLRPPSPPTLRYFGELVI